MSTSMDEMDVGRETIHQEFTVLVYPRETVTWEDFVVYSPPNSIALDGYVLAGPKFRPESHHFNFDHHKDVMREATMSTAMQVYFALKGGLTQALSNEEGRIVASIWINDTDQDTALAVWLLKNHKKFEGGASIPHINRLLTLTDRLDITGGAFPMNLDDQIVRQHNWVFRPYTDLRKCGGLANATKEIMCDNLDAVLSRLDKFMMGQAGEVTLDTRYTILYDSPRYKIVDEIGGNEARYHLYSKGMNAFVSLVSTRTDGKRVYSIGKRSRYIPFPVEQLYDDLNAAEGLDRTNGWNGSDIIGGSSRQLGSSLAPEQIREIVDRRLNPSKPMPLTPRFGKP